MTPEQFWAQLVRSDGCWTWPGGQYRHGYGSVFCLGRRQYTHRLAWELTNGTIPGGMFICHHCDNRLCCRPEHLFLGTAKENNLDASRKGRTKRAHCPRGHPYAGENLYVKPNGVQGCRTCITAARRERYARSGNRPRPMPVVRGEQHPRSVLTEADVLEIRRLSAEGVKTQTLRKQYGVAWTTIHDIVQGRKWRHLQPLAARATAGGGS